MNIWMLNHYATPPDTPGSTRHYDFARELFKSGNKVTIFAAGFSHRSRKDERLQGKQFYRSENIDGVEFVWIKTCHYYGDNDWHRVVNMLSYALWVIPIGLKIKERPDVILASSPHPFTGFAGWLLSRFKGASFIFEVRDLWPQTLVEIGGYSNKSLIVVLLRMLEKFLYHRAGKIVVLLPRASDYITGLSIPSDEIVYIPNGVSPQLFFETSAELPSNISILISKMKTQGKLLAVYAGAHGMANAMDTLLEAAKLLQDKGEDSVHFLLVGEGPEKLHLKALAQELNLDNIDFFNPIPKKSIPHLLKTSDIALISIKKSALYNFGMSLNKLWDYMICSRPIVWATNSSPDPVADTGCGITVPPEDPQAMADAILKLCAMSEHGREEIGQKGYEYVMKYHSIPVLAEKLMEVLEDVRKA